MPISDPVIARPSVAESKSATPNMPVYEMDSLASLTDTDFEAGEVKDENSELLAATSKKIFFEFELWFFFKLDPVDKINFYSNY